MVIIYIIYIIKLLILSRYQPQPLPQPLPLSRYLSRSLWG
jgi:hypothetical protein